MKLFDFEQERIFLAGMLSYSDLFASEISHFVSADDFYSKDSVVHKTIFLKIKTLLDEQKVVDISLLSHHLSSLNISFQDNIKIPDYLESIDLLSSNLSENVFKNSAEVVKLLSVRRELKETGEKISRSMSTLDSTSSYDKIIETCDLIFNEKIELYENSSGKAVNLFSILPNLVYERANDRSIFLDNGPEGPHASLNRLCGSLNKGGHITIVCAGSGVGKTQFTTHYCMCIAGKHRIPVLHLDNGEMSEEEIAFRMLASYSNVPLYLIESGNWADDSNYKKRVESALEKMNNGEFIYDYYNVGGKCTDEIISYIKRYYYSQVGRGNQLVINFDYIKSSFESGGKFKTEYQIVGEMVDKFKKLIQRDLVFEGRPMVSLMTSVQANRVGTVGNRSSDAVVDDESVISLSHRIKQFCSHMLILRNKTIDELQSDPIFCGRYLMKIEKARNHGSDTARLQNLVEMPDGSLKRNYINFDFNNFKIKDCGDLIDVLAHGENINELDSSSDSSDGELPI